jgi:predicted metal-dependent hydrolase
MESYLFIIVLFIIIIYIYFNKANVTYATLPNTNKSYLVRNVPDKEEAVLTLANMERALKAFVKRLLLDTSVIANEEMYEYIKNINDKIDYVEIQESAADSKHTSYSLNKGELLVFCIRSKETFKIHDMNELMYVAIHEIAHIGCPEVGHTDLFFKINTYLIDRAIEYGIYRYIDYGLINKEYCGMTLTVSVASKKF